MTTTMKHLVQEYLDERRGLGFALEIPGSQLMAFARFADALGHRGPLTCQLITSWARDEAKRATPLTWARRLEVIRPFATHRARIEPGTMCEANTFGRSRRRLAPHLYTDREIVDLLAAADRLSPKGTMRPATYRALFGLIAATGLRVSEALRLKCADVDLDAGMLTVRQTKFAKSRLVPLHPTTIRALKHYLAVRQRHLPTVSDGPFLASEPRLFPALASSAIVQSDDPSTLVRITLQGSRAVSTDAAPTAPAMPAFAWRLDDIQVAAVLTYVPHVWPVARAGRARRKILPLSQAPRPVFIVLSNASRGRATK